MFFLIRKLEFLSSPPFRQTHDIYYLELGYLMFPSWLIGLIMGTINPPTISITAENQWKSQLITPQ